jgi:hypothetical protein
MGIFGKAKILNPTLMGRSNNPVLQQLDPWVVVSLETDPLPSSETPYYSTQSNAVPPNAKLAVESFPRPNTASNAAFPPVS